MRHYIKKTLLVVVSYSLAFGTPVAAKSDVDNFVAMKNYVNGSGKKNFQTAFNMMEKDIPTGLYEQGLKKLKGAEGKKWFQAARLADNYSYFRINDSKIFIRLAIENGKTIFYANGVKISEDDFRNVNDVQNKLVLAYVAGFPSQKASLWNLFDIKKANADSRSNETATGEPIEIKTVGGPAGGQITECESLRQNYASALASGNQELAIQLAQTDKGKECGITANIAANTGKVVAAGNGANIAIPAFIIAALLLLTMSGKKKKKTSKPPKEVPEDTDGVGRGDDKTGGVNCGTKCGGTTTPTPEDPDTPTAPPTGSTDPNYYGENYGRTPVNKTKAK